MTAAGEGLEERSSRTFDKAVQGLYAAATRIEALEVENARLLANTRKGDDLLREARTYVEGASDGGLVLIDSSTDLRPEATDLLARIDADLKEKAGE